MVCVLIYAADVAVNCVLAFHDDEGQLVTSQRDITGERRRRAGLLGSAAARSAAAAACAC